MADVCFPAFVWHRAILSDRCTLDPSEGLVMLALVRYADEHGKAFPGFSTLCRVTRLGRTKVIEALAEDEARGLFVRTSQKRGKGLGSNHYQIPLEPPTKGLEGERRLVRRAHQSATRTSPQGAPGSPPRELALVRQANRGSAPGEPYLPTDLPILTPQGTTQSRKRAQRSPTKGTRKAAEETALPAEWQPTDAHRAYAQRHGLMLQFEVDGFLGWAKGKTALSWDGTFTTRLANAAKWDRQRKGGTRVQQGGLYAEGDSSRLDAAVAAEAASG